MIKIVPKVILHSHTTGLLYAVPYLLKLWRRRYSGVEYSYTKNTIFVLFFFRAYLFCHFICFIVNQVSRMMNLHVIMSASDCWDRARLKLFDCNLLDIDWFGYHAQHSVICSRLIGVVFLITILVLRLLCIYCVLMKQKGLQFIFGV